MHFINTVNDNFVLTYSDKHEYLFIYPGMQKLNDRNLLNHEINGTCMSASTSRGGGGAMFFFRSDFFFLRAT